MRTMPPAPEITPEKLPSPMLSIVLALVPVTTLPAPSSERMPLNEGAWSLKSSVAPAATVVVAAKLVRNGSAKLPGLPYGAAVDLQPGEARPADSAAEHVE